MPEYEVRPDDGGTYYRITAESEQDAAEQVPDDISASVYPVTEPVGWEGEDAP